MNAQKSVGMAILVCVALAFSLTNKGSERGARAMSENDEYLHSMLLLDRNIIEHAKVFIHDLETKGVLRHETAGFHSTEMQRSLTTSDAYLTRLENETDIAIDKIALGYLAGLHQHYQNAIAEQKEVDRELAKARPEKSFLRMKTYVIYSEMKKAEAEHLKMDREMGILEPESPLPGKDR